VLDLSSTRVQNAKPDYDLDYEYDYEEQKAETKIKNNICILNILEINMKVSSPRRGESIVAKDFPAPLYSGCRRQTVCLIHVGT
jgi:hypothetical protein